MVSVFNVNLALAATSDEVVAKQKKESEADKKIESDVAAKVISFSNEIKECDTRSLTDSVVNGSTIKVASERLLNRCLTEKLTLIENYMRNNCKGEKAIACEPLSGMRDIIRAELGQPVSPSDLRKKETCDSMYESQADDFKECSKIDHKTAAGCYKADSGGEGFMDSEGMAMATPMLGMISGANTLLGVYQAMNDRPQCYLTTSDFRAKEEKLDDQKKALEEKIRENIEKAEDAQKDYAAKLKEWTVDEGKIADQLEAIPGKIEEEGRKLDNEKVKLKMQADSKYNSVLDKMNELRSKFNDMVDAKSVALAENSAFTIHDRCVAEAEGGGQVAAANKQNGNNNQMPSTVVQGSFSAAFAKGKLVSGALQKRYDTCIKRESVKQKTLESKVARDLNAIRAQLTSYENVLGQINQEKALAEQEINYQVGKLAQDGDKETKKLAREYQRIQLDKTNEQALLKTQLERLQTENKKSEEQLSILAMKLSQYQGRKPPRNGDKSMAEIMDQCGADFERIINGFHDLCCKDDFNYTGPGKHVCKQAYKDYTVDPPKREKKKPKASSGGKVD